MIDDEQRERVLADLHAHWQAGRIDADEHERRTVIARRASTREELAQATEGLPESGRTGAGMLVLGESEPSHARSAPAPVEGRVLGNEVEHRGERTGGLIPMSRATASSITALVPILAVIAFFTTGSWLWFLAIPIVSIIVYGKGGGKNSG